MPHFDNSVWMELYRAAMLELDPEKLPGRVERAIAAVEERARQLSGRNGDGEEQDALRDAMQNLRVLRRGIATESEHSA